MAKANLHPKYQKTNVTCTSCSFSFETGSTLKELKVDTCSNCHPFFTGGQRSHSQDSRVEKFKAKYGMK